MWRVILTSYTLRITWRKRTCFISHYHAIYWGSHGGKGPVGQKFPRYTWFIIWRNKTSSFSRYHALYWASHGGTGPVASNILTLYIEHHMEEQDLLFLKLPRYILSITWRTRKCCVSKLPRCILRIIWKNRNCCVYYYPAIYRALRGGTGLLASYIIILYIEDNMEEQDLLRLIIPRYKLRITWRNGTCFVSYYHAIYWASHGGTGHFASHITRLDIVHHMKEQDKLRLILPG